MSERYRERFKILPDYSHFSDLLDTFPQGSDKRRTMDNFVKDRFVEDAYKFLSFYPKELFAPLLSIKNPPVFDLKYRDLKSLYWFINSSTRLMGAPELVGDTKGEIFEGIGYETAKEKLSPYVVANPQKTSEIVLATYGEVGRQVVPMNRRGTPDRGRTYFRYDEAERSVPLYFPDGLFLDPANPTFLGFLEYKTQIDKKEHNQAGLIKYLLQLLASGEGYRILDKISSHLGIDCTQIENFEIVYVARLKERNESIIKPVLPNAQFIGHNFSEEDSNNITAALIADYAYKLVQDRKL